ELPADCPWRAAALIEMVKIDLEKQWQRGRKSKIEAYLHFYPELGTRDILPADLLLAEYQARTQTGEEVDLDEIVRRFPRQAAELRRLIAEDSSSVASDRSAQASKQTPSLRESTQAEGRTAPAADSLPETFGRYRIV